MTLGPNPAYIFHITHVDNLPGILEHGGLFCENMVNAKDWGFKRIGHTRLKERRASTPVPIPPGGFVGDYVPFYFAPRSPMLYAIHKGRVEGYEDGQSPIVYVVAKAVDVAASGLPFVFTDGHPVIAFSEYYNQIERLDAVDWDIMNANVWKDTDEDTDRKRRRQAEFLVHQSFPLDRIAGIGVVNEEMNAKVQEMLEKAGHSMKSRVMNRWYFQE